MQLIFLKLAVQFGRSLENGLLKVRTSLIKNNHDYLKCSILGEPDRMTTFGPILDELRTRFPNIEERANVKIYVPGCGLGK